jgi:exodeoxyribonuclease V beta subunit
MVMIKFEAETIRLDGKNLIEASAGTGKTYSVSLLALRLILEKGINADKILMVTFAEAAAAEMAERMRLFVKMAYDAALGNKCPNEQIKNIVKKSTDSIAKLRKAYMLLDEINVYTIHGFCNKMLRELAFETNADFDFDIIFKSIIKNLKIKITKMKKELKR